jgi:hypothetical protein
MSKHKGIIEELAIKKLSPEKIYEYLQNMRDPKDQKIVKEEDIKPSSIRRHLQRHFNEKEDLLVRDATVQSKVKSSRQNYQDGRKINIDKANTVAHMIELALARIEEVETLSDVKKHQYTIQYMSTIKGLVDELNKVSKDIQDSGTIDGKFYQTQIDTFAKIVLSTIRALDQQYEMNYQLELAFTDEFKKQFKAFKERENMIFAGQLSPNADEKERNVNTFNDASSYV